MLRKMFGVGEVRFWKAWINSVAIEKRDSRNVCEIQDCLNLMVGFGEIGIKDDSKAWGLELDLVLMINQNSEYV